MIRNREGLIFSQEYRIEFWRSFLIKMQFWSIILIYYSLSNFFCWEPEAAVIIRDDQFKLI